MSTKYTPVPIYASMKISEKGRPDFSPSWSKWFTDLNPILSNLAGGVSGTVVAGGHTLVFTNGVLTSFT